MKRLNALLPVITVEILAVGAPLRAAPSVTNIFPAANSTMRSLAQVEVCFNGSAKGVDAADLFINGTPATNLLVQPGRALTFQLARFFSMPPSPVLLRTVHGASDLDEYLAGTNPTNAASVLRFDAPTDAEDVALSFLAVSNRTYAAESVTDLFPPTWLTLANLPARRTNHLELILEPAGGTNHFYRVVTPARP